MINLHDVAYTRLGTRDLDNAVRYSTEILGLDLVRRIDVPGYRAAYFRSDHRDHTLVWFEGDPAVQIAGFELYEPKDLDKVASELENNGFKVHSGTKEEAELRGAKAFISFKDPTGNPIDIVARPYHSGVPYHGFRNAGVTGFNHIGLNTTNAVRDEQFWTTLCNARVSDWIGDVALLRVSTVHHSIALFPTDRPGVQHVNHQVAGIDDIMRSFYFLQNKGVDITFGPGRHITSTAMFLYFKGPESTIFEYSHGVRHISEEEERTFRPRQFPWEQWSLCFWGSLPQMREFQTKKD
jgi:2,3-dihydroxy-p-cumate/2,3-dihydroxybenzoate 3,4-dioxygenase